MWLTISFQLFWCGFLCKDFIEAEYLQLSDNIPLMGCTCAYTSLCTKTVIYSEVCLFGGFHVYHCFCGFVQQFNI